MIAMHQRRTRRIDRQKERHHTLARHAHAIIAWRG